MSGLRTSYPSYCWNSEKYLVPATLLEARRWLVHAHDGTTGERLDALEDPLKLYRCHTFMNCAQVSPQGAQPGQGDRRDQGDAGRPGNLGRDRRSNSRREARRSLKMTLAR
jgi:hypothetical protein